MWAFIPDHILKKVGISWYPEKYWALALPSFFIITVIAVNVAYQGINLLYTKPFKSIYSIQGIQSYLLFTDPIKKMSFQEAIMSINQSLKTVRINV